MWLSFGGAKSQNEFAAAEIVGTKLRVMVVENSGNRAFHRKLTFRAAFEFKIVQGSSLARISLHCDAQGSFPHDS